MISRADFMTNSLWAEVKSDRAMRQAWTCEHESGLNLQALPPSQKAFRRRNLAHQAHIHQTYLSGVERG